ncbi:MAG: methionine gamma-lyase family protein [Christensenellales bacterium]|jgi:cystathionine beta-lyase family protein involved in aluminum resistance|nr:hypothetical protein [Clostridiales bacterium]
MINNIEKNLKKIFNAIEDIALYNFNKVLDAYKNNRVSTQHFSPTTGYGYDDLGRDMLCKLIADIFSSEKAIFSPLITSGTHALYIALSGILKPNDNFLCLGKPYDTLNDVIFGENNNSLQDFGINCRILESDSNNNFNFNLIKKELNKNKPKLILITRSSGYSWREALKINEIGHLIDYIKTNQKDAIVLVDNCYGEFVSKKEPTEVGADIVVGSFIKNIGGGIAPTGAYIVGKAKLIDKIANRFIAPSIGMEIGSYNASYTPFYQGLFLAPTIVKNAVKSSLIFGYAFKQLGYETLPKISSNNLPGDIIRAIKFESKDKLIKFVQEIQKNSPIDSFATPEPWGMPGYSNEIIMASGSFTQGSSIELSADAPIKSPYIAYLQGSLTYEHSVIALNTILKKF